MEPVIKHTWAEKKEVAEERDISLSDHLWCVLDMHGSVRAAGKGRYDWCPVTAQLQSVF